MELAAAYTNRGSALDQNGDYKAANSPAVAISFKPSAFYGRGIAERRRGDLRAAKADMDAALKMDPEVEARFAKWGVHGSDVPDAQDVAAH